LPWRSRASNAIGCANEKEKSHKRTSKARPARTREHTTAEQAWSPVEKAWLKFADKFQTFHQTPNNDNDRDDRPWEAALNAANGAAYAVIVEPATCLHDMEIKIQAWAFTSDIETGNHLTDLAHWQPHKHTQHSDFIASLRDDIRAIMRLVGMAMAAVRSIKAPSPADRDEAVHP
jgi:hypothetical protein